MGKRFKVIAAAVAVALSVTNLSGIEAFAVSSGYYKSSNFRTIIEDKDANGNTTYTNRANGKTYTVNADGTKLGDEDYKINSYRFPSQNVIEVGEYTTVQIVMPYNQKMGKLKVSKGKDKVSAKISYYNVEKNDNPSVYKGKDGYYYRDYITGERIYLDKNTTSTKNIFVNEAVYEIRLYGKKTGKAKLKFDVTDFDGNKIGEKTMSVSVVKDAHVITSATFGGKSLYTSLTGNKNYIYADSTRDGSGYTTKKSGKFKVKLSKNYKLKTIYVATPTGYEVKTDDVNGSYHLDTKKTNVDLNHDGDFNDVIDGIYESDSEYKYKTIKNGGKVNLSKVTKGSVNTKKYSSVKAEYSSIEKGSTNIAETHIIVVYQNKVTKEYGASTFIISRRVSK